MKLVFLFLTPLTPILQMRGSERVKHLPKVTGKGTRTHTLVNLILWSEYKATKLHSLPLTVPVSYGADLRKGGPQ